MTEIKAKPASRRSSRRVAKVALSSLSTAAAKSSKPTAKLTLLEKTAPAKKKPLAKKAAPARKKPSARKAAPAKKKSSAGKAAPASKPAAVKKGRARSAPVKAVKETLTQGRVLVVSGSDSSGGAGIQADVKTITALGGYAMTALTALTAQNTEGVNGIIETPAGFIAKQMRLVLKDIGADVVKIGIVPSADAVEAVHYTYMEMADGVPIVLDPVMMTDGGQPLVDREAIHLVRQHFLLHAQIVTPNIPEVEVLAGVEIHSLDDMKHAAESMITLGSQAVLLKGGKFSGEKVYDILYDENGIEVFEAKRVKTAHTHGAGCTLASAIAVSLAQKYTLRDAVVRARDYVRTAILTAPGFGHGHGPLNHAHTVKAART